MCMSMCMCMCIHVHVHAHVNTAPLSTRIRHAHVYIFWSEFERYFTLLYGFKIRFRPSQRPGPDADLARRVKTPRHKTSYDTSLTTYMLVCSLCEEDGRGNSALWTRLSRLVCAASVSPCAPCLSPPRQRHAAPAVHCCTLFYLPYPLRTPDAPPGLTPARSRIAIGCRRRR
jgi:hypothetical protein